MQRGARVRIVIVLLVAFVLAGWTRHLAAVRRGERNLAAATPLSRMNSYALALLLGGLRGPLVMFLWPSAEGQKSEKNLEDFDTKVEWIRLLQAEFDSVHIFQIWNKAYNISVLMANLANKYATILDALDYARSVDAERPNNVNIQSAIAGLFGEKLGSSAEKNYYKSRVREESKARESLVRVTMPTPRRAEFVDAAARAGASPGSLNFTIDEKSDTVSVTVRKSLADALRPQFAGAADGITFEERERARIDRDAPGFRRTELDPVLDANGMILPEYLRPRQPPVAGNDGSELQYLEPFQPFPYGVSAHALAYNYYKKSQVMLRNANQHHAQLSDLVVDSRPAQGLRIWSEDEWERGRFAELAAFGLPVPNERATLDTEPRLDMETDTRGVTPTAKPASDAALRQAIFSYELSARIAGEAHIAYQEHLEKYRTNFGTYQSHVDALGAQAQLMLGDAAYLKLIQGEGDRAALAKAAADHYRDAVRRYHMLLLTYYLEDRQRTAFFPPGTTIEQIRNMPMEQIEQLTERVRQDIDQQGPQASMHPDEWVEYFTYIRRAQARLANLQAA